VREIQPIPDSELARLAINSNLICEVRDSRNARYLTPFSNAERESLAYGMACASYSATADEFFASVWRRWRR
jgi:hypothetical protein